MTPRIHGQLAALLALALLVAACGGQQATENTPSTTEAPAAEPTEVAIPTEEPVAEATVVPEEAVARDETAISNDGCEEGFRRFDHDLLATDPVCIPATPERIIVAWGNVPALLRTDAPVVGMLDKEFVIGQFPEWETELTEIADIGRPLNLEVMLSLEPDLIITSEPFVDDLETFTEIAPTVMFQRVGTHVWREEAELIFDAAGQRAAFEAIQVELDTRIAELSGLLGDATTQELSIINLRPDRILLYTQYSPGGMIAEAVGFARPEVQRLPVPPDEFSNNPDAYSAFGNPYFQEISPELIDRAAGDFILVFGSFSTDDEAQLYLDEVMENPLWQTLNAVQAGNVHISNVNYAGPDIGGVHFMLDDLAEAFGVQNDLSPNPYVVKTELPESSE